MNNYSKRTDGEKEEMLKKMQEPRTIQTVVLVV